ncbi:glycosyltransferase family 2 protein [Dyella dinghuensis]|uniref:Glycosyltransferase family 2 protein n=1 Tax=Dyella dinghuensis TaxID=1920169 RepID=A0A432LUT9_9GAMM|nr:glycosyltransferase family 2 protein [Dyella dinghuensis]RUL65761.1 glycosyltransferase family 2 protein [Dyella dinghuensis]
MNEHSQSPIAVVIPCYRVSAQLLALINRIGPEVGWIIVVDDACPERSGDVVEKHCSDPRVTVLRHAKNRGVGGAVMTGYAMARNLPAKVVVKLDGDGQMDPASISRLAAPLLSGHADYAKGNRFYRLSDTAGMPPLRLVGNAGLSFLTKLSSGYWQLFDPTNGFTAIHRSLLAELDFDGIAPRYFFESDMLYHLNQLRAVIVEMPMPARYSGEPSSLRPLRIIGPFLRGNLRNLGRRVVYSYFVRSFSLASIELCLGCALVAFGLLFGFRHWWISATVGPPATAGTVMLAALPLILGVQLVLSWLSADIGAEPHRPVHPYLESEQSQGSPLENVSVESEANERFMRHR